MSFSFAVLFECIRDCDLLVHEILVVHGVNSCVRGFKVVKTDEAKALEIASFWIAGDLWSLHNDAKCTEGIV